MPAGKAASFGAVSARFVEGSASCSGRIPGPDRRREARGACLHKGGPDAVRQFVWNAAAREPLRDTSEHRRETNAACISASAVAARPPAQHSHVRCASCRVGVFSAEDVVRGCGREGLQNVVRRFGLRRGRGGKPDSRSSGSGVCQARSGARSQPV